MPSTVINPRIIPSVLDRLFDDAPAERNEHPADFRQSLANLKQAVARDLETLLNTRSDGLTDLSTYPEAERSLLTYGLPDFSSLSPSSEVDRNRIRSSIERAIAFFEPRLQRVQVSLHTSDKNASQFNFHIEALLKVDPVPEPVVFDAVLEVSTQLYKIE
ncbi:MAG: type VI secretion system baseplate subunit TssE [Moraxellaceae bacterium]|nr:type VI secretion system baseplate subunit TssE [Moraxellaceae bacterium]